MNTALRFFLPLLLLLTLCTCDRAPEPATADNSEPTARMSRQDSIQAVVERNSTVIPRNDPNPPAPGFNMAASDPRAVQVADSIVKYHGGRKLYDESRHFKWNFFGMRTLHWDKLEQRVRIEEKENDRISLLSYAGDTLTGRVRVGGTEITDPAELREALRRANSIFINDSYWLVHQFKLKDSGVTLKWRGDIPTDPEVGRPCFIIDQTFAGVGDTPQNRYRLYVDKTTYRINTWQFFRDAADEEPAMQTPWNGYVPYGGLLLSGDRGGDFTLTPIGVVERRRERLYQNF